MYTLALYVFVGLYCVVTLAVAAVMIVRDWRASQRSAYNSMAVEPSPVSMDRMGTTPVANGHEADIHFRAGGVHGLDLWNELVRNEKSAHYTMGIVSVLIAAVAEYRHSRDPAPDKRQQLADILTELAASVPRISLRKN